MEPRANGADAEQGAEAPEHASEGASEGAREREREQSEWSIDSLLVKAVTPRARESTAFSRVRTLLARVPSRFNATRARERVISRH